MNFCELIFFSKNETIALVVTDVEHGAMSAFLFCNHQYLSL